MTSFCKAQHNRGKLLPHPIGVEGGVSPGSTPLPLLINDGDDKHRYPLEGSDISDLLCIKDETY